jgi:hypothetical protein
VVTIQEKMGKRKVREKTEEGKQNNEEYMNRKNREK